MSFLISFIWRCRTPKTALDSLTPKRALEPLQSHTAVLEETPGELLAGRLVSINQEAVAKNQLDSIERRSQQSWIMFWSMLQEFSIVISNISFDSG